MDNYKTSEKELVILVTCSKSSLKLYIKSFLFFRRKKSEDNKLFF